MGPETLPHAPRKMVKNQKHILERGSRGARRGKRKLTARQRLSRKLGGSRVVAAAAEHLDRLDETRRDSRFSEQW